jgi:hypothetical protein
MWGTKGLPTYGLGTLPVVVESVPDQGVLGPVPPGDRDPTGR